MSRNPSLKPAALFHQLSRQLKKPKPGWAAQSLLLPEPRPGNIPFSVAESHCRKAGVLILLYPKNSRAHLLFTRRTADVLHHRGEISFPGGAREDKEDLIQAAVRETQEELTISPHDYRILGSLTPLYIPPSRFCIYPVAAGASIRPDFKPEPREVEEVIEIPLAHLLEDKNRRLEKWTIRGETRRIPFYKFGENKIWGATAMVLAEFIAIVKNINHESAILFHDSEK